MNYAIEKFVKKIVITIVYTLCYIILFSAMYLLHDFPAIFFSLGIPIILLAMYHLAEWSEV